MVDGFWIRIVACRDWMEPCYDEQPPAPTIDLSSLSTDAHYLTVYTLGFLCVVRLLAAVLGVIVVLHSVRRERVGADRW